MFFKFTFHHDGLKWCYGKQIFKFISTNILFVKVHCKCYCFIQEGNVYKILLNKSIFCQWTLKNSYGNLEKL